MTDFKVTKGTAPREVMVVKDVPVVRLELSPDLARDVAIALDVVHSAGERGNRIYLLQRALLTTLGHSGEANSADDLERVPYRRDAAAVQSLVRFKDDGDDNG